MTENNPLLAASTLPYQLPDFAAIRTEHYLPAIRTGLAEARKSYATLAENSDEPSFENVIAVLERPSDTLYRAVTVFYNITASHGTDELLELEGQVTELLTELSNELHLNPAVFARLDAVYQNRTNLGLNAEQLRLTEKYHQEFTLAGAALSDADREALAQLNLTIARAETEFGQQVTRDLNAAAVLLTEEAELAGLSPSTRASARSAAQDAGHQDGWLITFELPTQQSVLTQLENRAVRERIYTASTERGESTWAMAAEIAALRARKAALLGFETFAALAVADRTAQTPDAVEKAFCPDQRPCHAECSPGGGADRGACRC